MRFIRCAAITLTLAGAAVPAFTTLAFAQGPVVDVTPSTASPGDNVTFAVTCGLGANSAMLSGSILGLSEKIPMEMSTHAGEFVTTVSLPADLGPGTYDPVIDCSDGVSGAASLTVNQAAAPVIDVTPSTAAPGDNVTFAVTCGAGANSATLFGTTLGLSEKIPMEMSTHAGEFVTTVSLPLSISPGSYSPSIDCSDGVSGTASLTVIPSGIPVTGDGATSTVTGGPFAMAGAALLGTGGIAVGVGVIRRRRAGTRR